MVLKQDSSNKDDGKKQKVCCECGYTASYGVDVFGIASETWRCRECHEQACRRKIREDMWDRYGYRFADK